MYIYPLKIKNIVLYCIGTTPKYQWYVVKTQQYEVISKVNY